MFGWQLTGMAMALSVVTYPTHAFDYGSVDAINIGNEKLVMVRTTTKEAFSFPLETTLGMSQGYRGGHPGVDLRAPKGTGVESIADGVVVEVEEVPVGYGHFVRIAHEGTLSTLYAHLDKVEVEPGEKVIRGQQIGDVGMTGWTTGPHLHFEVMVGNKAVNPLDIISDNR